jgi:hypothetical protein
MVNFRIKHCPHCSSVTKLRHPVPLLGEIPVQKILIPAYHIIEDKVVYDFDLSIIVTIIPNPEDSGQP